jgi:PAS domain S-box-containing protein
MSALHTLIEYTPEPALLLSTSSTIVAANASLGRLTAPFHDGSAAKSLVGRSVDDLNIALIPDNKRVYQCLHAFLGGVIFQEPSQSHFRATKAVTDGNDFSRFSESTQHTTSRFWSGEAAIASVQEVDVFIPHDDSYATHTEKDSCEKTTSLVRAQMRGRRLYQNDQTFCMITFHKPTLKQDSATTPDPERHSFRCWSSQGGSDGNGDLRLSMTSSTSTDPGEQEFGLGIHNCRATLDCEGQAMEFSPAWYALTGMTPSESLGSGWVMAIHPEDVPDMLLSWNRIVEDGLDDWSYQSRFRMRDGSYRHCLVGVTALRGENGRVQKWCASMLDVNRSVLESMETEGHKQSILNLVSQAEVSLWSVNSYHLLDFREGSLPWDPSLSLERESSDICCAIDAEEDDKIRRTIQDILDSNVSAITLEHQAGHRWYRTRFMADIEENTTDTEGPSLVRAALGLTIDITDVRARTVLQIDNERLALNERAATDASSLKGQFLANVRETKLPKAKNVMELIIIDVP